jgi:YidC/Oxa1 family membrane protein insertase
MRRLFRLTIVLAAIVIFSGSFISAAQAQISDVPFQKAVQLEKEGKKSEALDEYSQIVRENRGKNSELVAEALYRGGLFARDRYGGTLSEKHQAEEVAWQMWKQLRDEYSDTEAYKKISEPRSDAPEGLLAALEQQIDRRNSADWKYQMIHALVLLCGNNPSYSYGLALILLALLVKAILFPLTKKQYAAMRGMQKMQPLVKAVQDKYKGDRTRAAEMQREIMDLYKKHGVNPFSSCLPTLLQLPFLILVFTAIRLYEFAFAKGHFLWIGSSLSEHSPIFMGSAVFARNLSLPDLPLLTIYALTNYVTMKMTPATDPQQQQQQNMMAVMTTGLFFFMFLSYKWSSAFVLYWLALNLLSIWQQYEYIYKPHKRGEIEIPVPSPSAGVQVSSNGARNASVSEKSLPAPSQPVRVRPRKKKR